MQTFLPYADYFRSAKVLDNKRLFKQSLECKQIASAITGLSNGWKNHCITRLWQDHLDHLLDYWEYIICESVMRDRTFIDIPLEIAEKVTKRTYKPVLIGNEQFHSAYRSHLLAKDFEHYKQFNWKEEPKSGYYAFDQEGKLKLYSGVVK